LRASLLYSGEYYAWHPDPPKGKIPLGAKKVRLRHTEQRKASYASNRSTFAAITIVDTGQEKTVRARELIDFWEAYKDEEAHLLKERREKEKEMRRIQLRKDITLSMVNAQLQMREIPLVFSSNYVTTLYLDTNLALRWLDITEEEISEAIERAIEREFDEA
jgi:hypothetical protein